MIDYKKMQTWLNNNVERNLLSPPVCLCDRFRVVFIPTNGEIQMWFKGFWMVIDCIRFIVELEHRCPLVKYNIWECDWFGYKAIILDIFV